MKYTEKYNFLKPEQTDYYEVDNFNDNTDKIEKQFIDIETAISDTKKSIDDILEKGIYTADDILEKVKTVDGLDSGLDADLFRGESVIQIANGGTGNTNGNAVTAIKLETARAIQTNLENNEKASFDGSEDITIGVTGVLPIINGGTGASTPAEIRNVLGLGNTTEALPIANGGTGGTTAEEAITNLGITPENIGAAASSHGTHVTFAITEPVMDGVADLGTAQTVARSDHKHPTDTSRAAVNHTHATGDITSGILPIERGGTGNTTGNAPTATKLTTARTIQTNLESTDVSDFDGSENLIIGVIGTLPIANGGTNATTAEEARINLEIPTVIDNAIRQALEGVIKNISYDSENEELSFE